MEFLRTSQASNHVCMYTSGGKPTRNGNSISNSMGGRAECTQGFFSGITASSLISVSLRLWGTLLLQVSIRPPHFLKLPSAAVRKRDGDVLAGSSLLMMLMRCRCNRRLLCNYIP